MKRLDQITITFPSKTVQQKQQSQAVMRLISQTENMSFVDQCLVSVLPKKMKPQTKITTSEKIRLPEISFHVPQQSEVSCIANGLRFGCNLSAIDRIYEESILSDQNTYVSVDELIKRLLHHLIEVNHIGINFSPIFIDQKEYCSFKSLLAASSNMYRYPTGEEWPFIIPATLNEFNHGIVDESIKRNPKFEIVYSDYNYHSVIQFDFGTNLTKSEVFSLFPDPYGVSYPGLENFFRTVFIKVDWGPILLRFDIGFGRNNKKDFGYWMIKQGGRI